MSDIGPKRTSETEIAISSFSPWPNIAYRRSCLMIWRNLIWASRMVNQQVTAWGQESRILTNGSSGLVVPIHHGCVLRATTAVICPSPMRVNPSDRRIQRLWPAHSLYCINKGNLIGVACLQRHETLYFSIFKVNAVYNDSSIYPIPGLNVS